MNSLFMWYRTEDGWIYTGSSNVILCNKQTNNSLQLTPVLVNHKDKIKQVCQQDTNLPYGEVHSPGRATAMCNVHNVGTSTDTAVQTVQDPVILVSLTSNSTAPCIHVPNVRVHWPILHWRQHSQNKKNCPHISVPS